jgi:hypothetical protein
MRVNGFPRAARLPDATLVFGRWKQIPAPGGLSISKVSAPEIVGARARPDIADIRGTARGVAERVSRTGVE